MSSPTGLKSSSGWCQRQKPPDLSVTAKLGPEHPQTIESLKQLVTLYESWPKADEAAQWRSKLVK